MDDDAWIEEARQQIRRRREAEQQCMLTPGSAPDDVAAWRRLCEWMNHHPHKFLFVQHVPPGLRSLLGPEGTEVRERWQVAGVLPVYLHNRYGWRLCENWRERLQRLAEKAH